MNQEQYQWLKDNGYDPAVYDVDEQGNIFENPIAAPATQKKMSVPRAFGTSFVGSLLPSAVGLGGAKLGMMAGAPLGPVGIGIGALAGGLGAGYLAGKGQEAALESFAPEAIAEMQRAQTDQPVASYLGGFAPNALAFRPSLQGMSGLLRPTVRSEETLRAALSNPNFIAPAANVAANVGASTAGQLINVAEGGEFSAPRFAADVALGTLFNRPTALGRAMGFQDLPQGRPVESPELAPARERAEFMAYPPREFVTPRAERGAEDIKTPGVNIGLEAPEQYFTAEGKRMTEKAMAKDYTNWWKSETEPTTELLKGAAEEVKAQIPRERLKELSQDPEVGEVLRDPSKMPAFIAKQADQTLEDVFQMIERRRSREFATAEEAANQKAFRELQAERGVPKETPLSDVKAAYAARQRTPEGEAQKLYGPELAGPAAPKPPSPSKAASGYDLMQPQVKQNATDAAREVYTRLQRPEGAGENRITQQDIDFAAEVAARRGLKIELDRAFAGDQEVRGMYFVDKKTGNRIIRVNPLMATPDTAIHEIGHDIFTGVTNKGMRRSLLDTALDSPAYKAELAARLKEGMPEAQARDFALEEGLIQAFGEKMPGINRGELRSWFKAFKASIKQLATGKLSPEDALAWMHYASTEAVPWKGVAVGKGGEERLQRGENENYLKAVQDFREGYQKRIARGMSHEKAIKAAASDTEQYVGELGIFEPSNKGVQIDQQAWLNQVFEADAKNWEPAYSKVGGKTYAEYFVPGRDSIFHDLSGLTWDKQSPTADFPNLAQAIEYVSGDPAKLTNLVGEDSALKLLASYQKSLPKTGKLNVAAAERLLQESRDIRYQRGRNADIEGISDPVRYWTPIELTPSERAFFASLGKADMSEAFGFPPSERLFNSRDYIQTVDGVTYVRPSSVEALRNYVHDITAFDRTEKLPPSFYNREFVSRLDAAKNPYENVRYQRAQQETPEFKNWFGESQVVDEQGKPLVVYHGTDADITEFKPRGQSGAIFFSTSPKQAEKFAGLAAVKTQARTGTEGLTGQNIIPAYVKLEKPFDFSNRQQVADLADTLTNVYGAIELRGGVEISPEAFANRMAKGDWALIEDPRIARYLRDNFDGFFVNEGGVKNIGVFDPTQVKSATANKGTFSPESKDIRYQRGILSKIQTPSELDYLVSKGGPFAEVGTTIKAAANTRDFKQGQWSSKYSLTNALPEEARVRLLNHLAGEFDSGVRSTPAADIRAAYDQLRNEYLPAIVNDYNNAGFMVRDTAGLRARGSNPTYFPLHAIADEVKTILTTKQGSPEWDKLKADFINWNTQLRQADGASLAEAQRYANEKFDEKLSITAKPPGIESGIPFSGARKPEGYPLPPSWRSNDILDILNNYTRRSATDFAYQQHVESSPVAMAALGAKTMLNNQPIPANILQSTAPVINDPSVQSVLREYRGTPAQRTEGTLPSIGRFVSAATIGPVSKTGDIGTSMFKGLAYLPGSEYASGLATFTNKIADWAALKERSYASGLNKRDAAESMRQVLGIAEDSTAFMDKAARVLSKATFVNDLESVARVIAQGWGETIVGINKKLALGGDKNATQMLDTLTPDWRTRSDADLAAQVGRLLQGSYDMRQLPASVLEGAAAPYLTWSKWSMGQYDSFMKYALRPAMQGNMKPLIGQMVIGLLGGGAISAVQEWLNNREGKDITWRELESWMQQNQGEIGADGGMMLGQKLLTMAQKMGTFGFAGDLVKMTIDAAAGGTAQGVATMPAMDAIYDTTKRAAAALKALDDGEDFGLVAKALMQDSLTSHLQVARVARNWLDEDENLRYDDRRRQRLYDKLMGLPSKGGTFAVSYSNLSEREFERGEIGEGTGEEALALVTRAREEATTPEDYASRIRKYKTSQNQIMPSMERQPMKAARYLSWLEGTEEGLGSETMRRYMTREYENKYRKSLIEGLSGLR